MNSSLNILSKELNLIEDHNKLNQNVHYDTEKEKDICQKSINFSHDKFNETAAKDKDKTDLNNSNDINGTSLQAQKGKR